MTPGDAYHREAMQRSHRSLLDPECRAPQFRPPVELANSVAFRTFLNHGAHVLVGSTGASPYESSEFLEQLVHKKLRIRTGSFASLNGTKRVDPFGRMLGHNRNA